MISRERPRPTRLIEPVMTFQSCGNSSRLVCRMKFPTTGRIRGSFVAEKALPFRKGLRVVREMFFQTPLGIAIHCAQLADRHRGASKPHTLLNIERWSRIRQFDRQRADGDRGGRQDAGGHRDKQIGLRASSNGCNASDSRVAVPRRINSPNARVCIHRLCTFRASSTSAIWRTHSRGPAPTPSPRMSIQR